MRFLVIEDDEGGWGRDEGFIMGLEGTKRSQVSAMGWVLSVKQKPPFQQENHNCPSASHDRLPSRSVPITASYALLAEGAVCGEQSRRGAVFVRQAGVAGCGVDALVEDALDGGVRSFGWWDRSWGSEEVHGDMRAQEVGKRV